MTLEKFCEQMRAGKINVVIKQHIDMSDMEQGVEVGMVVRDVDDIARDEILKCLHANQGDLYVLVRFNDVRVCEDPDAHRVNDYRQINTRTVCDACAAIRASVALLEPGVAPGAKQYAFRGPFID